MVAFLDRHATRDTSRAVRLQLQVEASSSLRDPSGAMPLGHWVEDGTFYCLLTAPTAEAVRHHHAARNLPCHDLHPIEGITERHPISDEDRAIVRAAITRLWPPTTA